MYVYVFVRRANAGFINKLKAHPEVRYASATTGSFIALVKLEIADLGALQGFLTKAFNAAGAIDYETAPALDVGTKAPRVKSPTTAPAGSALVEAAVRVRTEPGSAQAVMNDVDKIPGVFGTAVVAGSFDVLLIAWATSHPDLLHVLGQVAAVDHVLATETLLLSPMAYAPAGG